MIKKQLLFALRRLGRNKLTTSINILGLTFGILSCVVIYLYVVFEFSYDKFHDDADRVIPAISGDQTYHITFADTDYLKIFHYQWLAGNSATALQKPFSVVLTESEAKRYFQGGAPEDWMGRTVVYEDSLMVSVTGIVKDWNQNTDFGFKDLISYNSLESSFLRSYVQGWNTASSGINVFVKLTPGTSVAQVEQQFPAFFHR